MSFAVYSNVDRAGQGGGVLYAVGAARALAALGPVDLYFRRPVDPRAVARMVPVDLSGIRQRLATRVPGLAGEARALLGRSPYRATLVQSTEVPRRRGRGRVCLLCEFPSQRRLGLGDRLRLASFHRVLANSAYTAGWIARRWGRRATVLYPPVFPVAAGAKKPWILGVGRFTGGGRPKRQWEMVEMFRALIARGLDGWQLHLAGTVEDPAYLARVQQAARGLDAHFHPNLPREALERLLAGASLFWHATGAEADPETEPERMEHFGIATVEAMSAGAVPVVIDRGGQPEIVDPDHSGVLWSSYDECIEQSWALCHDHAARARLSRGARQRAQAFSFPRFAARARALIAGVDQEPGA